MSKTIIAIIIVVILLIVFMSSGSNNTSGLTYLDNKSTIMDLTLDLNDKGNWPSNVFRYQAGNGDQCFAACAGDAKCKAVTYVYDAPDNFSAWNGMCVGRADFKPSNIADFKGAYAAF